MLSLTCTVLSSVAWLTASGPDTKVMTPAPFSTATMSFTWMLADVKMYSPQSALRQGRKPFHSEQVVMPAVSMEKMPAPVRQEWTSLLVHRAEVAVVHCWPGR